MLRSRRFLGTTILALLAAVAVVTLLIGEEIVAAIAAVLMMLLIGVLVLDVATALRRTERQLQRLAKTARAASRAQPAPPTPDPDPSPPAGEADLLGTIRLLQAQYVGRLDRAQATLEAAADRLPASDGHRE